jgi:CheY-like chemotaxis protein
MSGADAVQVCSDAHLPKLVLMDVSTPGMDGYGTCELLKSNKLTNNIPIIFITASSSNEEKLRAFEHGAIDFLTKPVCPLERLKKQTKRFKHIAENIGLSYRRVGIYISFSE